MCCTHVKKFITVRLPLAYRNHYVTLAGKTLDGVKANFQALFHNGIMDPESPLCRVLNKLYGSGYSERLRAACPIMRHMFQWAYPLSPYISETDITLKPTEDDLPSDLLDQYRLGAGEVQHALDVMAGFTEKEAVHPMIPSGALWDDYGVYDNTLNNVDAAQAKRFPADSKQGYMTQAAEKTFMVLAKMITEDYAKWTQTVQGQEFIAGLISGNGPASMTNEEYSMLAVDFHMTTDVALMWFRDVFVKREMAKLVKMKPRLIFCFHRMRTALEWIFASIVTKYWTQLAEPMTIKNIPRMNIAERFRENATAIDRATARLIRKFDPNDILVIVRMVVAVDGAAWDGSMGAVALHGLLDMYSAVNKEIIKHSTATEKQTKALLQAIAEECNLKLGPDYEVSLPEDYRNNPAMTRWRFTAKDEFNIRQVYYKHLREMMTSGRMLTSVGNGKVSLNLQAYTDFDNPPVVLRAFLADASERPCMSGQYTMADGTKVEYARVAYIEGDDGNKDGNHIIALETDMNIGAAVSDLVNDFAARIAERAGACGFVYEGRAEVVSVKVLYPGDELEDAEFVFPYMETRAVNFTAKMIGVGQVNVEYVKESGHPQDVVLTEFVGGHLIYNRFGLIDFFPDIDRNIVKLIQRPNSFGGSLDDLAFLLGLMTQVRRHPEIHMKCESIALGILESLTDTREKQHHFDQASVSLRVDRGVQMAMLGEVLQQRTSGKTLKELLLRECNNRYLTMPFDEETLRAIPYKISAIQECLLGNAFNVFQAMPSMLG